MERVLLKLTSGQWLLTVACAGVFVYCGVTGMLDNQTIAAIVSMVFTNYFHRRRDPAVEGGQNNN